MIGWAKDFLLANALIVMAVMLAVIAALLIALYGLQIKLPLIGWVGPDGVIAERDEARATVTTMLAERKAAIDNGARIAVANTAATEKADTDEKAQMEIDRPAAERFIAAGGVRRCPSPRADAAASDQGAGLDEGEGALPVMDDVQLVTVLPEDVRICTENTRNARIWQQWGLTIEANHAAPVTEPVEP
jgi:hypothetical protein